MKRRQPFTPLHETAGGTENEDQRTDDEPRGEHATPPLSRHLQPESASKRKNAVGVVTGANCRARICTRQNAAIARLSHIKHLRVRRPSEIVAPALLAREFAPVTGGRRKPLKRLDSAKELRHLHLDFVPP